MSQNQFINKKNIGYINFLVNNTLGLADLTTDDKKFIINKLVENMNYVYSKLKHSKISKRNFKEAEEQFNQMVYKKTVKDLQKNMAEDNTPDEYSSQNIDQLKMDRDSLNNPNNVNYMDHSEDTRNNSYQQSFDDVRMSRDMVTNDNASIKYLEHPQMNLNTRTNNFKDDYKLWYINRFLKFQI